MKMYPVLAHKVDLPHVNQLLHFKGHTIGINRYHEILP